MEAKLRTRSAKLTAMTDRDVERDCSPKEFAATLRRVADAIERGEALRIQVASRRFVVPASAQLSIEHEARGGAEELELQLRWSMSEAEK